MQRQTFNDILPPWSNKDGKPYEGRPHHPAAAHIRGMDEDEFEQLKDSISRNGQRETIKLLRGEILDGRHREAACLALDREPVYEELEASKVGDPKQYVLALNVDRRHLSTLDRARMANEIAKRTRGGDRRSDQTQVLGFETQEQAAKAHGVSTETMRHVKFVDKYGSDDVIAKMESGELPPYAAFELVKSKRSELPVTIKRLSVKLPVEDAELLERLRDHLKESSEDARIVGSLDLFGIHNADNSMVVKLALRRWAKELGWSGDQPNDG